MSENNGKIHENHENSMKIQAFGWILRLDFGLRKLAASPAVVVLCGMAAGGGFGTLENVEYIARAGCRTEKR